MTRRVCSQSKKKEGVGFEEYGIHRIWSDDMTKTFLDATSTVLVQSDEHAIVFDWESRPDVFWCIRRCFRFWLYTPENYHGTWKSANWKGNSSYKSPCLGSTSIFQGVARVSSLRLILLQSTDDIKCLELKSIAAVCMVLYCTVSAPDIEITKHIHQPSPATNSTTSGDILSMIHYG